MKNLMMLSMLAVLTGVPLAFAAGSGHSVQLNWAAVTATTDGDTISTPVTYNVYGVAQGETSGGVQVASAVADTTYSATMGLMAGALGTIHDGSTDCYYITAVAAGQESAPSNVACVTFPAGIPGAPTGLTATAE